MKEGRGRFLISDQVSLAALGTTDGDRSIRKLVSCSTFWTLAANALPAQGSPLCPGALLPGFWTWIQAKRCCLCNACFCSLHISLILFLEACDLGLVIRTLKGASALLFSSSGPLCALLLSLGSPFCFTETQSQPLEARLCVDWCSRKNKG